MMPESISSPETVRLASFISFFTLFALGEHFRPRRAATTSKLQRWRVNLTLIALNSLLTRYLPLLAPFTIALLSQSNGWGLFNLFPVIRPIEIISSILLLDLVIYFQHRLFHSSPFFWRFHRMHHIDLDLDVSSGIRFHPIEIFFSLLIKICAIIVIGASPLSVVLFEITLNATAMFSHANIYLSPAIDRLLRLLFVTPDMHRVHHSIIPVETDSNFGFNLPWWDRLLGTYKAQPGEGHERMTIGLKEFRTFRGVWSSLEIPFIQVTRGSAGKH